MKRLAIFGCSGGRWIRMLLVKAVLPAAAISLQAAGFVSENANEFTATGDFDGDGRPDVVIVDKPSGVYRLGYQLAPGVFTWASPRSSGIDKVTGFTVGRMLDLGRDALAFTQPEANRVHVLDASSPASAASPVVLFTGGVGPHTALAIDIATGNPTPYHDLLIESLSDSKIQTYSNRMNVLWLSAGSVTLASSYIQSDTFARPNRVVFQDGQPEFPGLIRRGPAGDAFLIHNPGGGFNSPLALSAGLPAGVDYLVGDFRGSTFREFVFYLPGNPTLTVRPTQKLLNEPYSFGSGTTFTLAAPIRQAYALPGPGQPRLLVLFGTGGSATVFSFNGTNAPVALQSFAPPAGEHFTGAAELGSHHFLLFAAPLDSLVSRNWRTETFNGGAYVEGSPAALPAFSALSGRANLFFFDQEVFVAPGPNLLGAINAGDFTSGFNFAAGQVTKEVYGGTGPGLGNPGAVAVAVPNLTTYGLVNQYAPQLSAFSFGSPAQAGDLDVAIEPPPGTYQQSVPLSFRVTGPNAFATVYYRLRATDDWSTYNAAARPWVFRDATVLFYASLGAAPARKSSIHSAAYHFAHPPETLDSDGDGVPDFVEIQKGLDPVKSGRDADGDRYSDLCELLSGTNPNSAGSRPNIPCAQESAPARVVQGVRFQRGPNDVHPCLPGTIVHGFDLHGAQLALAPAEPVNLPGVGSPAASLYFVAQPGHRIVTVGTEPHFELPIGDPTNRLGRELVGLVLVPRIPGGAQVPFVFGAGDLATETGAWIAAAQQSLTADAATTTTGNLEIEDTLVALLFEARVRQELLARGHGGFATMTLFPYRPADAGRSNPPPALLLSLEDVPTAGPGAALKLGDTLLALEFAVTNQPFALPGLRQVAAEIYRISSVFNNDPAYPDGWFASPVNVLRDFLQTGVLAEPYAALTTLSAGELASAASAVSGVLNGTPLRPLVELTLVVRPDTLTGSCTVLDVQGGGMATLWHRAGLPYHLVEAFDLPVGTVLAVSGYNDLPPLGCAGQPIEVRSVQLVSAPPVSAADADGDGMPDALEWLLFGGLGQDGGGDADGDGVSNLAEIQQGSDPTDFYNVLLLPGNVPPIPVQIGPNLAGPPNLGFDLTFVVPPQFANQVEPQVMTTPKLGLPFLLSTLVPTNNGLGQFKVTLPNPGTNSQFFFIKLKPK